MIAKYNDLYYSFVKGRRNCELLTNHREKAVGGFSQDKSIFYKVIDIQDSQLTDIFDLELWVLYNTELLNVPVEWKIGLDREYYCDGKLLLRYTEGILPGWKTEEKNVCAITVDPMDLLGAKAMYKYTKKAGSLLEDKWVDCKQISVWELLNLHKKYNNSSI